MAWFSLGCLTPGKIDHLYIRPVINISCTAFWLEKVDVEVGSQEISEDKSDKPNSGQSSNSRQRKIIFNKP